jgi:O-antigen/teichoic acid export membrane protein
LILLINRIFGTPVSILASAGGQTLVSEAAKLRREGLSTAPALRTVIGRQFLLLGPLLLVVPFLPWLFPRIFGPDWVEAGRYGLALAPAIVIQGMLGPAGVILDVHERQDLHLLRELVKIPTMIGAVYAAKFFGGALWAIVILLSVALAVNSMFGFWLAYRTAKR